MSATPAAPSPSVERRRRRVALALGNPAFFGQYYMAPFDENWETTPLPAVAVEFLGFATVVRKGVVIAPPEVLKTTVLSQVYPLWLTVRYAAAGRLQTLHGALMSEYLALAERNLSVVAWHIIHNPLLAEDFVDVHGRPLLEPDPDEDKWTDKAIVVRRAGASKDPTWQAAGITTKIQGARLNHLIGDDLVTPGNANSNAVQIEARRTWDVESTTRLVEGGQALVAGNFNHPKDLVSTIAQRTAYAVLRRPTLHKPGDKSTPPDDPRDPTAVLGVPEKWSRARLMAELAEKPNSFQTIHLLRSATAGGAMLRDAWVTRIERSEVPVLNRVYLMAVDPAPGAESDPDPSFFVLTVAILTHKHLDIVECFADRMETTEQAELVSEKVGAYRELGHVGGIGVSKVALDTYAKGAFVLGDPTLRPLLHSHSLPAKKSKEERLSGLGTYFKTGWARVLADVWDGHTASADNAVQETTLREEWVTLPNQVHDDRLDSVDVLIREAISLGGSPARIIETELPVNRRISDEERILKAEW